MEVITTWYEFEYHRRPAGFGTWFFGKWSVSPADECIQFTGLYRDAKKFAIAEAKKRGWALLVVQS